MKNNYNYRVDVTFRGVLYSVEFPEFWLAKVYAQAIKEDEEVTSVYLVEKFTGDFEMTRNSKYK